MSKGVLYTPEGAIEVPDPDADVQLTPFDEALLGHLATTNRLLDLLVRLECGVIKRASLKADILAAEDAIRQQRELLVAAAEAEMDRLAKEEEERGQEEEGSEGEGVDGGQG